MTDDDADGHTIPELLALPELAGEPVTYRQLDYWVTGGLIYADDPNPGTGRDRRVPVSEIPVIRLLARLTLGGMRLQPAATLARQLATGQTHVQFAGLDVIVIGATTGDGTNPTAPGDTPDPKVILDDARAVSAELARRADKLRAFPGESSRREGRLHQLEADQALVDAFIARHDPPPPDQP